MKLRTKLTAMALTAGALALAGCATQADKSAHNMMVAAENFEVQREIVIINTRSGEYLAHVVGRCSLESGAEGGDSGMPGYLQVMCKHAENDYRKHFIKETPETSVSSMQLDPVDVSVYHTRWIIKPENLIPEIEVQTGVQ